jgi:hypothetical protein
MHVPVLPSIKEFSQISSANLTQILYETDFHEVFHILEVLLIESVDEDM